MCTSKFNSEMYPDPTPYEALKKVAKAGQKFGFRPLVYICSPYSGDVQGNVAKARAYCRFAVEKGCIPIAPHLLFPQFMDDKKPKDRELAMFMDAVLITKCAEVWVFGDTISDGMNMEIGKARWQGKPIRYFTERMEEKNA